MHCWSASHHQHGLTLTELLLGVVVISVLAAVTAPNLRSQLAKYRLNGAARQVLGDLMAARMKAISQNTTIAIFFPPTMQDTHSYTICSVPHIVSTPTGCLIGTVKTKDIQTNYRHVTLTADNNPVFLSRGTVGGATNATITLATTSRSQNITKNITVSTAGRVKIH